MLSCFLSVGRMCSSESFDKKGFSRCGKDLHRTISVLDHTLFSPSSSLSNFKGWQETTMASLPVCKNTQISLMACFIDDFLELFDREKKVLVLCRESTSTNPVHRCLSFLWTLFTLTRLTLQIFLYKITDSHRSRNEIWCL